ncbi:MAG: ATP-dependent DNA ligase [Chthoniobacterales bacterium]|nr:MAG: ATP-dependent DNA ligase [Chthoniobacterales bacterium]
MSEKAQLVVEGKKLAVSNLNKVLYPKAGFTKGQVIDYYIRIAPVLLPHLRDRPLTMKRYPNGVDGEFFYEKNCPAHRPSWVKTAKVWSEGNQRDMYYCLAQDLPTLIWAANLADLELHTSLARKKNVAQPTMMVFDLDPGPPADIVQCCQVGLWLRDLLAEMKLRSFPKTSGSKGLQVYVPLNTAPTSFDETKALSRALAEHLEREHGGLVVSKMLKALRGGKVLVDWSQNDEHKTTVCVYSLRAKDEPTVSTPVSWDEVENCLKKKAELLKFRSDEVIARVEKSGDLFSAVQELKQKLPKKWEL